MTTAASGVAVAVGGVLICDSVSKTGLVAQATKIAVGDYDKFINIKRQ